MTTINYTHVKYGATDSCVTAFQKALMGKGFGIPAGATGYYGDQTKAACAAFQRAQGWFGASADGNPGNQTFARLGFTNSAGSSPAPSGGRPSSPVPGYGVNYAFGIRNSRYAAGYHTGEDHAAPTGTPVVAVTNGKIAWANGNGGAYGNWIGFLSDNGHMYTYNHLSVIQVSAGQRVSAGQQIGKVGATGNVTGPHLHFEKSNGSSWSYGNVQQPTW